jgi:hypothetical protein
MSMEQRKKARQIAGKSEFDHYIKLQWYQSVSQPPTYTGEGKGGPDPLQGE